MDRAFVTLLRHGLLSPGVNPKTAEELIAERGVNMNNASLFFYSGKYLGQGRSELTAQ